MRFLLRILPHSSPLRKRISLVTRLSSLSHGSPPSLLSCAIGGRWQVRHILLLVLVWFFLRTRISSSAGVCVSVIAFVAFFIKKNSFFVFLVVFSSLLLLLLHWWGGFVVLVLCVFEREREREREREFWVCLFVLVGFVE